MSGGSTGERTFTDVLTSVRFWLIHVFTIPALYVGGFTCVGTGSVYEAFGTPRAVDYFTKQRKNAPILLGSRFEVKDDLIRMMREF
jgi:photosystem II cytochrome b559 subunit alpha